MIVAHRGLLRHAPENTLANFRACLELRLRLEFDVQRHTRDGQLVCIHDETVDRTTNGSGTVSGMTLEQIRRLDAASRFDPKFAGEKVPTVEEVLETDHQYRQHDIVLAVDLKAENVEHDVVRLAEHHEVLDRLLFIGRTISDPQVRTGSNGLRARPAPQPSPTTPVSSPRPWRRPPPIGSISVIFRRRRRWWRSIVPGNGRSLPARRSPATSRRIGNKRSLSASMPS